MKRMADMRHGRAAPVHLSESIESRENRWLKRFRAALSTTPARAEAARARDPGSGDTAPHRGESSDPEGEIAGVEGARLVESALRSGVEIIAVLFSETGAKQIPRLSPWIPSEARLLRTSDRLFASASGTETPQGVAALVRPNMGTLDDLLGGIPLVLVLAGVQDPGNVGTLVRTAEAFGASGIAACAAGAIGAANPYAPKALRASAGAALRLPIVRGVSAPVLLAQLKVAGVRVYAACPEDASDGGPNRSQDRGSDRGFGGTAKKALAPWEIDWRAPAALLIGNEGAGLPADLVRSADAIVRIPQTPHGNAASEEVSPRESLNAAIAGSILLYEAARQRGLS